MFPEAAARLLDQARSEWAVGRYYEAHEILEDVAECFDDDDPSFDVALALTRAAACLHKLANDVGAQAVPGKLATALETLRAAPDDWGGLQLGALVTDLEALASRLSSARRPDPYPVLR